MVLQLYLLQWLWCKAPSLSPIFYPFPSKNDDHFY